MKLKLLFSLILLVVLCSCGTDEPIETEVIETEIETEVIIEVIETTTVAEETTTVELEYIAPEDRTPQNRRFFDSGYFPFVMDENVIGTWEVCGYVEKIEEFPQYNWGNGIMKNLIFNERELCTIVYDGDSRRVYDWTAGLVLDRYEKINSAYVIKTIDDIDFLFYEWKTGDYTHNGTVSYYVFAREGVTVLKMFEDLRSVARSGVFNINESEYKFDYIKTYRYSDDAVFEGAEDYAMEILENAKDPGLGIRKLHETGITGEGVNVAIIDQNLVTSPYHPEYDGKIVKYHDIGTGHDGSLGSMHGPAVASLLVGETTGVAPNANLYYVAVPSWTGDSQYFADALYWIIEENNNLPENEKIRVVSISAQPSGEGTPYTQNLESYTEAVEAATAAGILVMDCRVGFDSGFIGAAYNGGGDINDCVPGYPGGKIVFPPNYIHVPNSMRTMAEHFNPDEISYAYWGQGGLSWGMPYAAGVLALGWQVDPTLGNDEIVQILYDTCYVNDDGAHIINPPAFIEYIEGNK